MVHGELEKTFSKLHALCLADLLQELGAKDFPEEIVARVLPEFGRALISVELNMSVEFTWRKELPYTLLGLSHPVPRKSLAWGEVWLASAIGNLINCGTRGTA